MKKCRILLVDDYVPIRAALRALLKHYHGVRIVGEASDGEQAIELMTSCQPHLILMDINMPRMNGIEATAHIKNAWKEAIVIGLYALENHEQTDAIMSAGAAAVVSKHHIVDLYPAIHKACLNRPLPFIAAPWSPL
jgi:DNA-binding NarL/FixJ family response regulator